MLAAMSPVQPTKARNPRSMVLAIGGVVLGLVLVVLLFVLAIPSLTESGTVKANFGVDTFNAGSAESRARSIAADGPYLLGDVSGRQRTSSSSTSATIPRRAGPRSTPGRSASRGTAAWSGRPTPRSSGTPATGRSCRPTARASSPTPSP